MKTLSRRIDSNLYIGMMSTIHVEINIIMFEIFITTGQCL